MDWPKIDFSSWFYRNIFSDNAGPIEKISVVHLADQGMFEAQAFLRQDLKIKSIPTYQLYGNCDGTGTNRLKKTAITKAISEALERWAFYQNYKVGQTTDGMAAYPSFTTKQARQHAKNEAIERWSLHEWWDENLSSNIIDDHHIELVTPFIGTSTIIAHSLFILNNEPIYIYGFATADTLLKAKVQANIEMLRNKCALSVINKVSDETICDQEKNLCYFSTIQGNKVFINKINTTCTLDRSTTMPKTLFDSEIVGPWSKYARVWKIQFESTKCISVTKDVQFRF
jgi:hypothetical protein